MDNKYDKLEKRLKPFENLMNFKERDLKILYWFMGLLIIPVFAYIYSFPMSLLLGTISKIPFINFDNNSLVIERIVLVVSFILAFLTQFYMWRLYQGKKKNSQSIT